MNKKIGFFDLDGTLWDNKYEVWIIDKNTPNKPLLILNPIEYTLISKGYYRKDKIQLDYNGQKYWISKDIFDKLKKKSKSENVERFGNLKNDLMKADSDFKGKVKNLQEELNTYVYEQLSKIISDYGKDNSIDLIMGKMETVYNTEVVEITNQILDILKSKGLYFETESEKESI